MGNIKVLYVQWEQGWGDGREERATGELTKIKALGTDTTEPISIYKLKEKKEEFNQNYLVYENKVRGYLPT